MKQNIAIKTIMMVFGAVKILCEAVFEAMYGPDSHAENRYKK